MQYESLLFFMIIATAHFCFAEAWVRAAATVLCCPHPVPRKHSRISPGVALVNLVGEHHLLLRLLLLQSCLHGTLPHVTSLFVSWFLLTLAVMYLRSWAVELGMFRHKEVRMSAMFGLLGSCASFAMLQFLTGRDAFLDFEFDDDYAEFARRSDTVLASLGFDVCPVLCCVVLCCVVLCDVVWCSAVV